jgi:RHS repeat-associated protein
MKKLLTSFGAVLATGFAFAQIPYPGNDSDSGVSRSDGPVYTYTGNLSFTTLDVVVAGAVGETGLTWGRTGISRTSQTESMFGLGHNWTHSWQWELVRSGEDSSGRSVISLKVPAGWVHRFTEVSPGRWMPAPSVEHRIVSSGRDFVVLHQDGGEVRFTRTSSALGEIFEMRQMIDPHGIPVTFEYEEGRLSQVKELGGRWLKISYAKIDPPGLSNAAKPFYVISKVHASDGQTVEYSYSIPSGEAYPVLHEVHYPDDTKAAYTYVAPRKGSRLMLQSAIDPRGDRTLRGRTFHYRGEAEAAAGQLMEIRSGDGGLILAISSDNSSDRSYGVRESNGTTVYRKYNPGGNIASEIDGLGQSTTFEYDNEGKGFRVATTNQLGHATRLQKDPDGDVVKITFPDSSTKLYKRDLRGRVLEETNELGQTRKFTRDEHGRVTNIMHPDGTNESSEYNRFGQPIVRKDRGGGITKFTYDERGLRTRITNAIGESTHILYDNMDRVAGTTDARGNATHYERDRAGRVIQVRYADETSRTIAYNHYGQIVKNIDAAGSDREQNYDSLGRKVSSVDALGHITSVEFADIAKGGAHLDDPVRTIAPSGTVSSFSYDPNGRMISRTTAFDTPDAETTKWSYDAAGRQSSVTNAKGIAMQLYYDSRGRRTQRMTALNNSKRTEYDPASRKISQTDPNGNTITWSYDAMGRQITATDAEGEVTRREYNALGRLAVLTDSRGNAYRYEYDLLGRQTALVYPDGSRETTTYDEVGNKGTYTNRSGSKRTFSYDKRNREIGSSWNDGSPGTVKEYDDVGRLITEDNGVSRMTFAYDPAGRLVQETQDISAVVTGGSSDPDPQTVSYEYTSNGERKAVHYPDGTIVSYEYNGRGQVLRISSNQSDSPLASYIYDDVGNATRMPRQNETETIRVFNLENRVTDISERGPRRVALAELDYVYDAVGNRTSTTETLMNPQGLSGWPSTRDSYHYDKSYQVTGVDYDIPVSGHNVGTAPRSVRFSYDSVGNRLEVNETGVVSRYTANSLNQYTQVGEFAPTHDQNGNLTGMGKWLYRYDASNRLILASDGKMSAEFFYDARNRCVARSFNGRVTLNTYDSWKLIEERNGAGTRQARYIHGRGVDEIVLISNQKGVFYPHYDVLGNVTMVTDASGAVTERYRYSVDGQVKITATDGAVLPSSSIGQRWMFTGREWLEEVGLYDYRNRVYSAEIGRFLQTDHVRFVAGDMNLYRYVENSYLGYSDPYGLWPWDDWSDFGDSLGEAVFSTVGGTVLAPIGGLLGGGAGFVVGRVGGPGGSIAGVVVGTIAGTAVGATWGSNLGEAAWNAWDPFNVETGANETSGFPDPSTLPTFDETYNLPDDFESLFTMVDREDAEDYFFGSEWEPMTFNMGE